MLQLNAVIHFDLQQNKVNDGTVNDSKVNDSKGDSPLAVIHFTCKMLAKIAHSTRLSGKIAEL